MNRLAIEINGAGLLVADAQRVLASEPGYAIVDEARTITGSAAYQQARLQPAKARSGFWSALSVEGGAAHSHAELAYEHLKQVWNQAARPGSAAVLVVPGDYDAQQLGLVLGIAQECGIGVEAMIDSAVAASALRYDGCQLLYVDASLRTVSAARLDQTGAASVDARERSHETGLGEFTDDMVRAIARVFVLDTRLDPLHNAETEQRLYDGLPGWLDALHRDGAVTAEIRHAGEPLSVELTVERVRSASLRLFREIARLIAELRAPDMPAVVQLNSRLAKLPGLRTELERIDGIVLSELAPGFPATSALARMRDATAAAEEVRLLRRLPFTGAGEPPVSPATQDAAPRTSSVTPTHVVYDGIGYRLDSRSLEVADAAPLESVNGARVLAIGERGRATGGAYCVLRLEQGRLALECGGAAQVRVNDIAVDGSRRLDIGDIVRVGDPFAELHIVALES